ncbi:TetR/AcrR family transcriptional regulator [Vibrio tapetis]|uniref:Putative Transcription regulator, TetR-like n=1 Tax=Vibrio tapetis subsp. tapetis TaxID=1671868 RepID=A0A2N8ZLC1_9VIBR|nr:TetR/AcrR family transcriptional regulator [Vibrio tapetis]MDN3681164.1 TetR/AcrR family transcriptional regulator [Vibrio tapetis subsp. quintayensis]SON52687.1 putative Transcription regulator, TetR-like [Vibrio tapetis subsp. tapetis]
MFGLGCSKGEKGGLFSCNETLSKKQQSIVNREIELINLAKTLVEEQGFANFTMDKLTAISPYSKGTIYNHFCSKEDVVLALCILSLKKEAAMFIRSSAFEGTSREKVMAMHVAYRLYVQMEPVLSDCAMTAKTPWVLDKASPKRVQELNKLEEEVIKSADLLVQHAVETGDLQYSSGLSADAIVFANWSVAFGSNALAKNASESYCIDRLQDPYSVLHNASILLDGLNWKPLSSEWDYRKTWQRVEQELFPEEVAFLASKGLR